MNQTNLMDEQIRYRCTECVIQICIALLFLQATKESIADAHCRKWTHGYGRVQRSTVSKRII